MLEENSKEKHIKYQAGFTAWVHQSLTRFQRFLLFRFAGTENCMNNPINAENQLHLSKQLAKQRTPEQPQPTMRILKFLKRGQHWILTPLKKQSGTAHILLPKLFFTSKMIEREKRRNFIS